MMNMTENEADGLLPAVESETLILVPHTVTDLDDLVAYPEKYLISITKDPAGAAAQWHERLRRNPYGSDGLVRLSHYGTDVFTADMWDDVDGIWFGLVRLCRGFLDSGKAEASFYGQPLAMTLRRKGNIGILTVAEDRIPVQREFVPGVLDHAEAFFTWVENEVGLGRGDAFEEIAAARALLPWDLRT